jgi:YD repeat-containing protein
MRNTSSILCKLVLLQAFFTLSFSVIAQSNQTKPSSKNFSRTIPAKGNDIQSPSLFDPDGGGGFPGGGGSDDIYIPPKTYTYNYGEMNNVQTDVATLTTSLMGDTIDPASGAISFTHNDVTLPGNFALSVAASRTLTNPDNWYNETLEFGNWSMSLPHIRSSYVTNYVGNNHSSSGGAPYWTVNNACSGSLNDNPSFTGYLDGTHYQLTRQDYWNGDFISIPGQGSTEIIRKSGGGKTTNNFSKINCINTGGVNSFEVTTPDGTKYLFGKLKVRKSLKKIYMGAVATPCPGCETPPLNWEESFFEGPPRNDETRMQKWDAFMMVTKVTDRHGNTINYSYNSSGTISRIESSDGRLITFAGGTRITSMTTNGRTWQSIGSETLIL